MRRPQATSVGLVRLSATGALAVALGVALAACQVPLPQPGQSGMPNPFPSMPGSGSPQSSPSLPSPSLPSPSLPSLPSPSLPSLPSPSLPSLPSGGQPSSGGPSLPSASSPSGGGAAGGLPGVLPPSGSGPQQGGGSGGLPPSGSGSQSGGGPGGMEPPSGGDETGDAGGPDAGWEVSNEGMGSEPGGPGEEDGAAEGEGNAAPGGVDEGGDDQRDALARALGELDGEILDERMGTVDAAPSSRGASGGEAAGEGPAVPSPPVAEPEMTRIPTPTPPDQPDARDDDVVARQLREAAMAETDPELREQLWEEYRRYKSGL